MSTTVINANFFPLGLITPTSGTPQGIFTNFPDLAKTSNFAAMLFFQAHYNNTGMIFIGSPSLNYSANAGVIAVLLNPGDSWSISGSPALNIISLSSFMVDCSHTGDGVFVSMLVR